ncbi:peptidase, M16 family protein [Pseudooceanicola batsensis HTCC2597]|uniref:Peptidase, M16 family protein n=1 Tax=Pseudooceanicola batsensis (strain ATCC BAA-863 / DSM 15984 / KCTC 12145 / HTCC2597) TaxID=252305 RepID=A3TW17_PSEBH|nr:pitrilysin family protein [Pseudooceanicola batsensis]EAQ03813.1 peptidase, M16 family protein [Pseudooceanicola batsensis HTCC2597]
MSLFSPARILKTVLALLLLAAPSAQAAEDLVTDFTLGNGMQVVVIEDHRAPVVVHMVWYRAGAADETPGVSGVAHFLEHLLFKGTDDLAPGELSKTVAENGGTDNAFTSHDYTGYYQRVAADRLGLMMSMEADRMRNIRLTETDILTEREVIIEERNQRVENSPQSLFREQAMAAQYLNHRYGVPVIGWRHEMEQLGLDDAMDYYRTFYAPNNAILVVAGDVTPDEVRTLAEEHYGPIPANPELPEERDRPAEPRQTAERRLVFEDPRVAQPYVSRSYLAPERDPGDQKTAAALVILADILGGGQTGYLTEKLTFEQKKAVYTSAWYRGQSLDDTTFGVYVVPAEGVSLEEAERAMDETLDRFLDEGVDEAQLERIKMQIRAGQVYARDNVESMARRYGSGLTQGLTIEDIQAWPDILQEVTEADILTAAREVLDRDRAVTGYLRAPARDEPSADANETQPANEVSQ